MRQDPPAHGGEREDAWLDYVTFGGLPRILEYSTDEGKASYLKGLLDRVYLDDIVVRHEERRADGKREVKSLEIDFVCNLASRRYYIQSAFAIPDRAKMEQEQKPLVCVRDSFKKIIVVKERVKPWRNDEGVLVVGLTDFLLDPSLMDR